MVWKESVGRLWKVLLNGWRGGNLGFKEDEVFGFGYDCWFYVVVWGVWGLYGGGLVGEYKVFGCI